MTETEKDTESEPTFPRVSFEKKYIVCEPADVLKVVGELQVIDWFASPSMFHQHELVFKSASVAVCSRGRLSLYPYVFEVGFVIVTIGPVLSRVMFLVSVEFLFPA